MSGVEFALHPQHEASCDSEIQAGKDFKNKFRKQLESLPKTSLNSEGKEKTLEQHFLIWDKFTPGGKVPRFRG